MRHRRTAWVIRCEQIHLQDRAARFQIALTDGVKKNTCLQFCSIQVFYCTHSRLPPFHCATQWSTVLIPVVLCEFSNHHAGLDGQQRLVRMVSPQPPQSSRPLLRPLAVVVRIVCFFICHDTVGAQHYAAQ